MYNIKVVIENMKKVLNLHSNMELSRYLNISYNTFNTWLKRGKIPQEVLINFTQTNNISLDYLLFNKKIEEKEDKTKENIIKFNYYGKYEEFNINNNTLSINPTLFYDNALYLLKIEEIYIIVKAHFNPIKKIATIENSNLKEIIKLEEFKKYNIGIILQINNNN